MEAQQKVFMVSAPAPTARSRPKRTRLEPASGWAGLLTALTLAGLLVGLDRRAFSGKPAHLAGVRSGLSSGRRTRDAVQTLLRERKLNIDLLMVLAALGAGSIDQFADGAILLFLFSLSNTLQAWALGRTKDAVCALMKLKSEGATVRRNGAEQWLELGAIRRIAPSSS